MPTYEFRCPDGHDFERFFRKISDASSELSCPTCGQLGTRRISAGAGLLFKGSGFYLTDYGKNAHREAAPATTGSDGSGSDSPPAETGASAPKTESVAPKAEPAAPSPTKSPPTPPAKGNGES